MPPSARLETVGWAHRSVAFAGLLAAALSLGGCYTAGGVVPAVAIPADYHDRYPVTLSNAPETLDIFPVGPTGAIDLRQRREIEVFAQTYDHDGQGQLVMRVPQGAINASAVRQTAEAVRHLLLADGVRNPTRVVTYAVDDPSLPTPVRLSYVRLKAGVAETCGNWPEDLASGTSLGGWDNHSYYNLGCASTKTLTAQIDDPRDVVRPRAEDPTDVQLRTRAIGSLRTGSDPGTIWKGSALTPISTVGNP